MNRRTTLLAIGGAVPLLMTARSLRAETTYTISPEAATKAKLETLQYGTLAKRTSVIARTRSGNTDVRDFAHGEILEQTAIAKALTSLADPPPAQLTVEQETVLQKVKNAPDSSFDSTYLKAQIAGHEALLVLQNHILSGDEPLTSDTTHIAEIAKAFIQNHLKILHLLLANNA